MRAVQEAVALLQTGYHLPTWYARRGKAISRAMSDIEHVVSAVSSSKKYRTVCPDTVRRVAERELAHHGTVKPAIKATKRRLHQVYAAFEHDFDYDAAYDQLEGAYKGCSESEKKMACRQVLGAHSSTRERLPILDRFYADIFQITGCPRSILDLGCGLNPLALPWMAIGPGTRYIAVDIDAKRIQFLNRYLGLASMQPLARCQDLLVDPPGDAVDVALLLKMSPSLERQEPGATARLLDQVAARFAIVSFAIKSLTGREKGMLNHYQQQFLDLTGSQSWQVEELIFASELVYVVERRP